ncbi:MAG: hypothetical protein J1E40_09595, partial [Oscillospiraceae bacterium]|nr:hypothetical protein [Oscillospiraceae bacterium]
MRLKNLVCVFLSACVILLSSCNDSSGNIPSAEDQVISDSGETTESSDTAELPSDETEDVADTEIPPEMTEED